MKKATRAIYPLSSSIERKKNSVTMIGRNERTLPTPAKMPLMIRFRTAGVTCHASSPRSVSFPSASIPISKRFWKNAPITLKESQNTSPMIRTNSGIAVKRPVSTRSILRLRRCPLLSAGRINASAQTLLMKRNRMSAIAAERSSPRSVSIWVIICSRVSCSLASSFRAFKMISSPSASLDAANRTGIPASFAWSSIRWLMLCRHLCTAPPASSASQKSISSKPAGFS